MKCKNWVVVGWLVVWKNVFLLCCIVLGQVDLKLYDFMGYGVYQLMCK